MYVPVCVSDQARRQETAVDRLSSGRTTSNKRPGSGASTRGSAGRDNDGLTPVQVAARCAQEASLVRRAEQEQKEARLAAKAKALSKGKANPDSAESIKRAKAKEKALAERAGNYTTVHYCVDL